jgi:hypothetical protein
MWCEFFHCLPSDLDKEDGKTIDMFIAIKNEMDVRKELNERAQEAENKLR